MDSNHRARRRIARTVAFGVTVSLLLPLPALAKTTTWTDASPTNDLWSNPGNWDNGVPVDNDDVAFSAIGGTSEQDIPGLLLLDFNMGSYTGTLTMTYPPAVAGGAYLAGTVETSGLTVGGDLTVAGTLDAVASTIDVGGSISISGTADMTSSNVTMGGQLVVDGELTANSSTIQVPYNTWVNGTFHVAYGAILTTNFDLAVSGTLDAPQSDISVGGSISGYSGSNLDFSDGTVVVSGNLNVNGAASCTWGSGLLTFDGPGDYTWSCGATTSNFGYVSAGVGGRLQLTAPGALVTMSGLDVIQGTLELTGGDLEVYGTTLIYGTFENVSHAGASMQFDGKVQVLGTFRVTTGGNTLSFASGDFGGVAVVGTGTVEMTAPTYNRINLEQDGIMGGAQWNLDWDGTSTLVFDGVRVQDGYARSGIVTALNGEDAGNNTNWYFGPKTTTWTGAGPSDNWSDALNWSAGVPVAGDDVLFNPVGGMSVIDIDPLSLNAMDMSGFTGTLSASGNLMFDTDATFDGQVLLGGTLTAAGSVHSAGTMDATNASINVAGNLTSDGNLGAPFSTIAVGGNVTVMDTLYLAGATADVPGDLTAGTLLAGSGAWIVVHHRAYLIARLEGSAGATLEVMDDVAVGPGAIVDMGAGTLVAHVQVDFGSAAAVSWAPGGMLRCESLGDCGLALGGTVLLGRVDVVAASPTTTVTMVSTSPVTVTGNLQVATGVLDLSDVDVQVMGSTDIHIGGALTGSYTSGGQIDFDGTLTVHDVFEFTGPSIAVTLADATIEGDFTVSGNQASLRVWPGATVSVAPGASMTVSGGTLGDRAELALDGTAGSAQWLLNLNSGATGTFENIMVRDSDASPGQTAVAAGECIDGGNNDNWAFVGTAIRGSLPTQLALRAVPNPFNPQTVLHCAVPTEGRVTIRIYNVRGALVRTLYAGVRDRGAYALPWDGTDDARRAVGSGVYFCRIALEGGASRVEKLVLVK